MKIKLNPSDFCQIPEKSMYNYNYYRLKDSNMFIYIKEICHEDAEFCEYYLVDLADSTDKDIFIGCSRNTSGLSGDKEVEVDFLYYYT